MKGLDVGFERMCKFEAGSLCTGNGKLRPAWSFWALLNDTPCGSRVKCMLSLKLFGSPYSACQKDQACSAFASGAQWTISDRNLADDAFRS